MESSDAHSGVIKMSGLQQYTVAENGTETPMESSRTSLSIRKYKDGGLTIGDSGRKSCEPISESRLNREMMSLIEGAAAKREEMEAKYPSYAGCPGVPDAGPIIDRRGRAGALPLFVSSASGSGCPGSSDSGCCSGSDSCSGSYSDCS